MNWIDFTWPMISAASATLGAIHGGIWFKRREQSANLAFALAALSLAVVAIMELLLMRTHSPHEYAAILRLVYLPLATLVVGLVGFLLLEFRAGSRALAAIAILARTACLLPDFLTGENAIYLHIRTLEQLPAWAGATISIPGADSVPNPWFALDTSADILLVLFIASVIVGLHRRQPTPKRRRALGICYATLFFVIFAQGWNFAVLHLGLHGPLMISPAFLALLMLMGYELGFDLIRAGELERGLSATERELVRTQRQMNTAVDAAGVGLWSWDKASGEAWFSDLCLSMLGYAPGEVDDQDAFRARLAPTDQERFDAGLQAARDNDGGFMGEYRITHPATGSRWIVVRGQVEAGLDETLARVHGAVVDITSRKEAEDRFHMVVQTATTAMLMFDRHGTIALANPQAERLFGFAVDEIAGMNVEQVLPGWTTGARGHSARLAGGFAGMLMAVGGGRDLCGRRRDGSEVPIEVVFNPVPIASQLHMLAAITDLSEKNRFENELAMQRDELAHLSRVALLSELSGSLAHELNQPLTAVLANAQAAIRFLARDPPDLEEVRNGLLSIVESDKRAGEVIRRLRVMLRKDHTEFRRLNINEVIEGVLKIIRGELLNRNVETVLDLTDGRPVVHGDLVQLQQVLMNLIVNARDAMRDADAPEITLRTKLAAPDRVVVSVSDIGHGILGQDSEKIFTPFFTTKQDGLGLGLPVCRSIITAHQGVLWAVNNAGPGATVGFSLPGEKRDRGN